MMAKAAEERFGDNEAPGKVQVEFVGEPPYHREFLTSHTIPRGKDTVFTRDGLIKADVPRDLVWHKEKGWMLEVDNTDTDLLAALKTQPFLKVHE